MFEGYGLSSSQINNEPFCFDYEERKGRKRICYTSERKEREEREKIDNTIHHMLIVCFSRIEGKKKGGKNYITVQNKL